jgi:hypothetical protein
VEKTDESRGEINRRLLVKRIYLKIHKEIKYFLNDLIVTSLIV